MLHIGTPSCIQNTVGMLLEFLPFKNNGESRYQREIYYLLCFERRGISQESWNCK